MSETQLTNDAVTNDRGMEYRRQANTLMREARMMGEGLWSRVQQKGWLVGRPKATKWTCSNAGTKVE